MECTLPNSCCGIGGVRDTTTNCIRPHDPTLHDYYTDSRNSSTSYYHHCAFQPSTSTVLQSAAPEREPQRRRDASPPPTHVRHALLHPHPEPPVRHSPPSTDPACNADQAARTQNRGKTRLAKWYTPYSDDEKVKLKGEVHRLVAPRDQKYQSNFVEFRNSKVVYRRYAGLFFCACVDTNDNELAYLEAIHFFVEVLDSFFGNVCELDLVFNFYKVYAILDEVFLAGEIEETSKQVVLTRLEHLDKLE